MPQPGDWGLTQIGGLSGLAVRVAQWLRGSGWSNYQHALLLLDDGTVLEAEPGGARITPLEGYGKPITWSSWPLTDAQRAEVVLVTRTKVGVPYSVLTYISLVLLRLHIRPDWVVRRVESDGEEICSELVDRVYLEAGLHLFDDGRLPGDVDPAELEQVLRGPL